MHKIPQKDSNKNKKSKNKKRKFLKPKSKKQEAAPYVSYSILLLILSS
jgi:hypothetical protein